VCFRAIEGNSKALWKLRKAVEAAEASIRQAEEEASRDRNPDTAEHVLRQYLYSAKYEKTIQHFMAAKGPSALQEQEPHALISEFIDAVAREHSTGVALGFPVQKLNSEGHVVILVCTLRNLARMEILRQATGGKGRELAALLDPEWNEASNNMLRAARKAAEEAEASERTSLLGAQGAGERGGKGYGGVEPKPLQAVIVYAMVAEIVDEGIDPVALSAALNHARVSEVALNHRLAG